MSAKNPIINLLQKWNGKNIMRYFKVLNKRTTEFERVEAPRMLKRIDPRVDQTDALFNSLTDEGPAVPGKLWIDMRGVSVTEL